MFNLQNAIQCLELARHPETNVERTNGARPFVKVNPVLFVDLQIAHTAGPQWIGGDRKNPNFGGERLHLIFLIEEIVEPPHGIKASLYIPGNQSHAFRNEVRPMKILKSLLKLGFTVRV